jgi:hypothetical protein
MIQRMEREGENWGPPPTILLPTPSCDADQLYLHNQWHSFIEPVLLFWIFIEPKLLITTPSCADDVICIVLCGVCNVISWLTSSNDYCTFMC